MQELQSKLADAEKLSAPATPEPSAEKVDENLIKEKADQAIQEVCKGLCDKNKPCILE